MHVVGTLLAAAGITVLFDLMISLCAPGETLSDRCKELHRVNMIMEGRCTGQAIRLHYIFMVALFFVRLVNRWPYAEVPAFALLLHISVWKLWELQDEVMKLTFRYEALDDRFADYRGQSAQRYAALQAKLDRTADGEETDEMTDDETTDCSSSEETY